MDPMNGRRVAIVAGGRTPFAKAGTAFAKLGPLALAKHAVTGLLARRDVDPVGVESIAIGVVIPEPKKPNLAREVVLETGMPPHIEAQTISSYCITGLRTASLIADAIAQGRIECGIAGGVEWLSGASQETFREPSTGLSMGEHTELTIKEWEISRESQDRVALTSHQHAVAARDRIAAEIIPLEGLSQDTGPRSNTSLELLARLPAVYDRQHGSITAGNASPVTDGASAVLLMSEARARADGREPLAFIRAIDYAALHPNEGLLMAPAIAVPRVLNRAKIRMRDIGLIEIHEAFAGQVLANVAAWESGWKCGATDPVDWERVNVNGSSLAVGHPWAATGGRILTTLAYEMARRDVSLGLISICAAGGMAGAFILERG
jgi:acetyl-CoA acetyltransferase family protein